tara:strand:- start:16576 stop:17346 length:771 start_codon:yes stop_codon:yes gene_type:complete
MNSNDFVSVNHILAEVLQTLDDTELRKGFAKGWYVSRIQDALQELAFDTFFDEITLDKDFPINTLSMELPKNIFNIRELYLYNGDCCSPETSQVVWWKRLYNNGGDGEGYTARVKDTGTSHTDPYLPSGWTYNNSSSFVGTKYYANIQNGTIMFSSDCKGYSKVRLVVNGMGAAIGDAPIVPRFFERAINDYVEERFYNSMKSRDSRAYRGLWNDSYQKLYDVRDGSWKKARMRVSSMDTWEKESLNNYITNMYHK